MARNDHQAPFFPRVDDAILTSNHPSPLSRPQIVGPVFDKENVDRPISEWSDTVKQTFFPDSERYGTAVSPCKPDYFDDRYLRAFLADNERLRLSVLWYYTRDVLNEAEFLSGLQEKAHLAQESSGWEFAVIGILDLNVYIRLATVGLELGILPRGECICAHTVVQPPGNVFHLPNLMEDWRFEKCPYLEDGGLRAYAGVPLRIQTESGECVSLGSLCVASSTSEEPLSKTQHQTLVHLADWIISDLVQCTRLRRQRERHRMSKLIAELQKNQDEVGSAESVLDIVKTIYPDAIVALRPSSAAHVELDETYSIPIVKLQDGLYEDIEYLDDLIANSNHVALPTSRPVRILSAACESISGPSLLVVASKDFHLVFDDVDSWFVQTCAGIVSQMWQKRLLGEALKAKEKFLRAFSHQLRTPVHGILGFVELLAEELKSLGLNKTTVPTSEILGNSPKIDFNEPLAYLKTIKMPGHDLTSIIDNLITLNKWMDIAMAERDYGMHNLNDLEEQLGKEVARFMHGDTRYTTSTFFTQSPSLSSASFRIDLRVVRDALFPLITNAIQHTPRGTVSVATFLDDENKQLIVDIEDSGCGIEPEFQKSIFEAYEKINPHSAGAGIGLTLASKFASLLNGSVHLISSHIGRGSHFRATFGVMEIDCCATPPQQLAMMLTPVPSDFLTINKNQENTSLTHNFENVLSLNGFNRSNTMENSIIILEAASEIEHRLSDLSSITPEQFAICLLPGSEEAPETEQTECNVFYLTSPFTTSALRSTLERARKYLIDKSSLLPLPKTHTSNLPSTNQQPERIENFLSHITQIKCLVSAEMNMETRSLSKSSRPFTLIVDDNTLNLRLMETYCKKRGLPYISALDGQQAIKAFSQHQGQYAAGEHAPIELIFMDLQMPICGGIEATKRIRLLEQQHKWVTSSVFVMTGQDSNADRNAADEAEADEYFVKPVVLKHLDRTIMEYFPTFKTG